MLVGMGLLVTKKKKGPCTAPVQPVMGFGLMGLGAECPQLHAKVSEHRLPGLGTPNLESAPFSACLCIIPFSSIVILYLRFGAQVLQDNFVAELSTNYQNYILSADEC